MRGLVIGAGVCVGLGLLAFVAVGAGLATGNKGLWIPAAVVFQVAWIGVLVCGLLAARRRPGGSQER